MASSHGTTTQSIDDGSLLVQFQQLDRGSDSYASEVVNRLLQIALQSGATDIHLAQHHANVKVQLRVFGGLHSIGMIPDGQQSRILSRLKALAQMVTYRCDIPQEGRIQLTANSGQRLEARVGTLPTLHGERAVIRLSKPTASAWQLDDLKLPETTLNAMRERLLAGSGVILITGPAASGKTTTAYACLREILNQDADRSIVTLEDPVEQELESVAQSEINDAVDYSWSAGLKALLRQDPDVLMIGEIRDAETAAVVFQAAITGQLVIATMHARSAVDALQRLLDMGVQPYHLRSSLDCLTCQRLLPAVCSCKHSTSSTEPEAACTTCGGLGISGHTLLAELLPSLSGQLSQQLGNGEGSHFLQESALAMGMQSLQSQVQEAVAAGVVLKRDADRQIQQTPNQN